MTTTTIERPQREFIESGCGSGRVSVRRTPTSRDEAPIDLDTFIDRLRFDVFDVYATVRQAQRESALPQSERAAILATAGHRARSIADVINLYCAVPVLGLDAGEAFGVPI